LGAERARTRLSPEVRREQILEAAERVFLERDPNEVTFEEIAEAAGVSRGLVYNYFGDKQGLIAAAYVRGMQRLDDRLAAAVDGIDDVGEERLRRVVRAYLGFAAESATGFASMVGSNSTLSHPEAKEARTQRIAQVAARWFAGDAASVLASAVVGLLESAAVAWIETDGRVDLDETAAQLATLLWGGVSEFGPQVAPAGPSSMRQQYQATTVR
jgi:AcrR family transcriptional regulator